MLFIYREKRFSNLIETTQKKYRESKDREFVQTTKNLYVLIISIINRSLTSFHINWVDNMNSAYIYANRICRNVSTHYYNFYSNGSTKYYFKKQPRSCILFLFCFTLVFRWGIQIAERKRRSYPQDAYTHQEKGIFVFEPFLSKHITHFIETVNHLLNKLGDRSLYPYVLILFFYSYF